jgi:hypothetical protein
VKILLAFVLAAVVGVGAGWLIASHRLAGRHAAQLAEQEAAWQAERADLEAELERAREQARLSSTPLVVPAPTAATADRRLSPQEILLKLQSLGGTPGAVSPATLRQAIYWLEELTQTGASALPVIGEFLARNEDFDLDTSQFQGRSGFRDRVPLDFAAPPSLRLGLFDVVRRIGGPEAEAILAQSLALTGRGIEVAYLANALQEMAPAKYRDQIVAVARTLLASGAPVNSASPLDRNHRDHLFNVLAALGDTGFANEAQTQLVRADSQIDRAALKYLQQTLGPQAVPIAAQAYQNPMLTNSAGKEPLARLALNFVGVDPQANAFYQQTINDPLLTRSHRKNLIEDLNQDGFADTRNLTPRDLPIIENRIALIHQLAPSAMDDANAAAFKEALKDLVNMRAGVLGQSSR